MLKVRFSVDRDALRHVADILKERGDLAKKHEHQASVGIHEQDGGAPKIGYDGKPSAISLIEAATVQEFGTGRVPDRSFIRTWFDSNLARLKREAIEAIRKEYDGESDAVAIQAADWGTELSAWITSGEVAWEPLAPRTVQERLSADLPGGPPLFATGQLAKAIRALVDE